MSMGMPASAAAGRAGADSYVVRGYMDDSDISASIHPNGTTSVYADPEIAGFPTTCGGSQPVGNSLTVQQLIGVGLLNQLSMDGSGVALAIVDTGINLNHIRNKGLSPTLDQFASWTSSPSIQPGWGVVGHGTMCAYSALLIAPNATLLDHAVLNGVGSVPGGSAMSGVLSNALQSYSVLLRLMRQPAGRSRFHSLVVSNSWGMYSQSWDFPLGHPGRFGDNMNHPFNVIVSSLSAAGADIVFAAGNCGPHCPDGRCDSSPLPPIFLANSHDDVMCVAGVDTNGAVVGYSSEGPGVLGNRKPDIAGYTHYLGSEAFGPGVPDTGTSTACPVVAGVIASLRSAYPFLPGNPRRSPAQVRNFLRNHAQGSGQWTKDWGHGIISTTQFPHAASVL